MKLEGNGSDIDNVVAPSLNVLKKYRSMATRLQLSLSAKALKNLAGLMSISDPFAVVTVRGDNPDNRPEVVGRTDM